MIMHKPFAIKAHLVLICAAVFFSVALFAGTAVSDSPSESLVPDGNAPLGSLINEYRSLIRDMDQEVFELQGDLDWLEMKIGQARTLGRHVPEAMLKSAESKTVRLRALEHSRADLKERLQALEKTRLESSPKSQAGIKETTSPESDTVGSTCPDTEALAKDIRQKLVESGLDDWVNLVLDAGCLRMETRLPILFPTGSAVIAQEYQDFLKNLASMIQEYDIRIVVDGYADIQSIKTGKYPSNFELGAQRAANVVHALVGYGIKPSVFRIGTTGRYRFKAGGISSKNAMERRADLIIVFAG